MQSNVRAWLKLQQLSCKQTNMKRHVTNWQAASQPRPATLFEALCAATRSAQEVAEPTPASKLN